jgi:hypothetical protein
MRNSIPEVGANIAIGPHFHPSRGRATPVCRIKYDGRQWVMVPWGPGISGMLVFMNAWPEDKHTHIRITSIQPTGKGAYADPVTL